MKDLIKLFKIKPKTPKSPEIEPYELVKGARYVILYRDFEISHAHTKKILNWLDSHDVKALMVATRDKDALQIFEIQRGEEENHG